MQAIMEVVAEKPPPQPLSSPSVTTCSPTSPPPNCAICLGTCTNKCFSNSCMHQFCFTCLLEWSKIKPECPLCKQTFKSIIHNVKSINEYDEHFIPLVAAEERPQSERNEYLYLPPAPSRHQFHFRTTFTVDPGGELAIQQMLMSHPLTNVMYMPGYNNPTRLHQRGGRRRDTFSTSFRRSIYSQDLWVFSPPDITARYRDVSPYFYNANPAARTRLVPWLNRELNALLCENTQQVMQLVDVILQHLLRHHIRSRRFKNLLLPYLGHKTPHFIHEFYNFMRSPFDMIGYDRHVIYMERPASPTSSVDVVSDVDGDDSDVAVVNTTTPLLSSNPFHRPTIEVIEINSESSHDSDVIIREPTPPVIVDLINSDSDEVIHVEQQQNSGCDDNHKPILPLKARLKNKQQCGQDKRYRSRKKSRLFSHTSSSVSASSTLSSEDSSSSSSTDSSCDQSKYKKKRKRSRYYRHQDGKSRCKTVSKKSNSTDVASPTTKFDSDDDDIPLSQLTNKYANDLCNVSSGNSNINSETTTMWSAAVQKQSDQNVKLEKSSSTVDTLHYDEYSHHDYKTLQMYDGSEMAMGNNHHDDLESCTDSKLVSNDNKEVIKNASKQNRCSFEDDDNIKQEEQFDLPKHNYTTNIEGEESFSGPSTSSGRLRYRILRKESDLWYLRPRRFSSDSSD